VRAKDWIKTRPTLSRLLSQVPGDEKMNAGRANQNRLPGYFGVNPSAPGAVA